MQNEGRAVDNPSHRLAGMFADLRGRETPLTIDEMKEAAAAGWAEDGMPGMDCPGEEV